MATQSARAASAGEPEISIAALARKALELARGDPVMATKILAGWARKDHDIYCALVEPAVDTMAYEAIRQCCRAQRRVLWNSPQPTTQQQRAKVVALGRGTMDSLMRFQLPSGLFLADARRDDVTAAAEFYRKQSKDMGHKARWLQLIAQHMTARKTVKQVLTDTRLAELREEATRD